MEKYPLFDINQINPLYLKNFIDKSKQDGSFHERLYGIQKILVMIESPEYKQNTKYTSSDIRELVKKFTYIFRAFIFERGQPMPCNTNNNINTMALLQ